MSSERDKAMRHTKDYTNQEERKQNRQKRLRRRKLIRLAVVASILLATSSIFADEFATMTGSDHADTPVQGVPMEQISGDSDSEAMFASCTSSGPSIQTSPNLDIDGALKPLEEEWYDATIPLSKDLQKKAYDLCQTYEFPYPIFLALMDRESKFNPTAVSSTNDYGICQINRCNLSSLSKTLGLTDIQTDPVQNMEASLYLLNEYRTHYENDNYHILLMRYNMGPTGAENLFKRGIYSTEYSREIIRLAQGKYGYKGDLSL